MQDAGSQVQYKCRVGHDCDCLQSDRGSGWEEKKDDFKIDSTTPGTAQFVFPPREAGSDGKRAAGPVTQEMFDRVQLSRRFADTLFDVLSDFWALIGHKS